MQHDLFHIYTVDAHTMILVRNLRRFFLPDFQDDFALIQEAVAAIDHVEILYLAAIFHDLGKGLGGDHSRLGAESAQAFCVALNLSEPHQQLVHWLVENHLLMSTTSQRQDISDPDVIRRFANVVRSTHYLNYLLLLTVADIKATSPNLWNSWRSSLLQQLYRSTYRLLESDQPSEVERSQLVQERRRDTTTLWVDRGYDPIDLDRLWEDISPSFLLNHTPQMLADIAIALHLNEQPETPVVLLSPVAMDSVVQNLYDLVICSTNRKRLFADCVAALNQLNLQVMSAQITTGSSTTCYDSFVVMTYNNHELGAREQQTLRSAVSDLVANRKRIPQTHYRHVSRQLKQFNIPTQVHIREDTLDGHTQIELIAADRPGLLVLVGNLFDELDLEIHSARISTLGERVEDFFTVSGRGASPTLTDQHKQRIRTLLPQRITEDLIKTSV